MINTCKPQSDAFLGETLFHFLGTGTEEGLLAIFDSIVRRGLLLTVGNKDGKLDRFKVAMVGDNCESLEVMQHARACFTDIPEKLLSTHAQQYGRFAIGFSRKTILEWGGNPVIYVPNHPDRNTLETSMAITLYCLHRVPSLMDRLRECFKQLDVTLDGNDGIQFFQYMDQTEKSFLRLMGFVKEMSSQDKNDYQYLYEREWRIVDGAMKEGSDSTRELSDDEYMELTAKCERWKRPLEMSSRLLQKYPHTSMLQFFRFFNGLPGKTVSQATEVILVPNDVVKKRVATYVADHHECFSSDGLGIRIFGENK
jgi:hypothetical protein